MPEYRVEVWTCRWDWHITVKTISFDRNDMSDVSLSYSKLLFRIQVSAFRRENFSSRLRRKSGFPVFNLSNELLGYFWAFRGKVVFFKGVCCDVVEFCVSEFIVR